MKIKYKTNYSGYITLLRGIQLLLKDKTLNFTQLGAYICFATQADFDKKHDNYTCILRDDNELAKEWGCSYDSVRRNRQQLIKKGLLVEENNITRFPDFYIFEAKWVKANAKLSFSELQSLFTKMHKEIALKLNSIAKIQNNYDQNAMQSFNNSSKVDLSLLFNELTEEDKRDMDGIIEIEERDTRY